MAICVEFHFCYYYFFFLSILILLVLEFRSSCSYAYSFHKQLKPGGEIPQKGKKITVSVQSIEDLSRDVIKVTLHTFVNYFLIICFLDWSNFYDTSHAQLPVRMCFWLTHFLWQSMYLQNQPHQYCCQPTP